ncbi:MAG TPA: arginine--tRNA ligase [Candidatus Acidoferrales bacterium]|nr:arginine--tRNA ligase [Candidatus Acidoferrales bacterium]
MWSELKADLARALEAAGLSTPERLARLDFAIPRDSSHGDWTSNLCMLIAREAGRPPRALAEELQRHYPYDRGIVGSVEVAGPGFLNFRYAESFLAGLPARILEEGAAFGDSDFGGGERVLVEFVSANPTGPMNVVSARAAAVGATLVALLNAAGWEAASEFYVNDAGNQVDLLGASLASRFAARVGIERPLPPEGYQGEYLNDLAAQLPVDEARAHLAGADGDAWFRDQALDRMVAWQRRDLEAYGVTFDRWFRESVLHASGEVTATLEALEARGAVYRATRPTGVSEAARARVHREEGAASGVAEATWLRTHDHGDDMDRVVIRADGRPTYLLPDLAYHRDKRRRGFRRAINLWGPDHHAYVGTLTAALAALGLEPDFLRVLIVQQVNLMRAGQPVKMSKRRGEFDTLSDLVDEVGPDGARFFFLMRSCSAHLDFDLDLARRQNDENPAFYVQYAHARIASIRRLASERGLTPADGPGAPLAAPEELALVRRLATFPEVVRGAAAALEPQRLPTFLVETAAEFHRFYHACRVVSDDVTLSRHRLRLCSAAQQVLRNGLALMGVSAPERLEREAESVS